MPSSLTMVCGTWAKADAAVLLCCANSFSSPVLALRLSVVEGLDAGTIKQKSCFGTSSAREGDMSESEVIFQIRRRMAK